jgi:hypothetical protein
MAFAHTHIPASTALGASAVAVTAADVLFSVGLALPDLVGLIRDNPSEFRLFHLVPIWFSLFGFWFFWLFATLIFGLPLYLLLRWVRMVNWPTVLSLGALVGYLLVAVPRTEVVPYAAALASVVGVAGAAVFMATAKLMSKH